MSPVILGLLVGLLIPAVWSWFRGWRTVMAAATTLGVIGAFLASLALPAGPEALLPWGRVAAGVLAAVGGGPFTAEVLRWASEKHPRLPWQRTEPADGGASGPAGPDGAASQHLADTTVPTTPQLRGGAWIGVLERLGIAASLLTGWPAGLPVVLAVKGLGRYPELKAGNSERFIIGTFASVLWASAACGIAMV